jgi:outer membrane protein assembly factor BamB
MLRAALVVGASLPLGVCPVRRAAAQADPQSRRPQAGDHFVPHSGEGIGKVITAADLPEGGPPVTAYPFDPGSNVVRNGSRLNQILLVRIGTAELTPEMQPLAADGIVAFSGVCPRRTARRPHIGEIQAWDMNTGQKVWTRTFQSHNWGPVLATGGGLVFAGGTNDRFFRAFDAKTGELVWQWRTNSGITGVPSTFSVDGVQYVAVQSGWGVDAQRMQGALDEIRGTKTDVPQGGVIWVFALRN